MNASTEDAGRKKTLSPADAEDGAAPGPEEAPDRGLGRIFLSLRQRNYRFYFFGQLISLTGSTMQDIGLIWLVLQVTHSAFQVGLVGALEALPVLLFSLIGGVLADRWPKRQVLLWTRGASMVQAFVLWALLVTATVQVWQIYVLALLLGLMDSAGRPAAHSFTVELVGREDLSNAMALSSLLFNVTRIAGAALSGVVIAAGGTALLFLLNALSFVAALAALLLLTPGDLHAQAVKVGPRQTTWESLREGLSYVRGSPALASIIMVGGLVLLCGANFGVVLPFLSTDVLHTGVQGFGFLSAATGVGSLVIALGMAWRNLRATLPRVLIGALIFALLEAALAFSRFYPLSLLLIAGVSGAEIAFTTLALTMVQTIAPDHLRGRVMSVLTVSFDGSLPLGYVLMGWLTGRYGAPAALLIGAVLSALVVVAGWLWTRNDPAWDASLAMTP